MFITRIFPLLICLFTMFGIECRAQQSIEKLVNSLEKNDDVCHLQNVVKRDPHTHKIVKTVKKITILHASNNIYTKLCNAFNKESQSANEVYNSCGYNSSSNTLVFNTKKCKKFFQMNCQGNTIELIMINKSNEKSKEVAKPVQQNDAPFFNINFDFFSR